MVDKIIYAELNFPGLFSNIHSVDHGILFYNEIINLSHDSNHAIIYDYQNNNYDEIIKKITYFYESKNISPRIYSSLISGQLNKIKNVLERNNYTVEQYISNYLIHKSKCIINEPYTLKIKRIENKIELLTMNNFFDDDWNFELLQRQVKNKDFHLLIGYEDDIPVSKCTIECINKIGRVDDVETKLEYRRKGYSRQMLRYLINYNYEICDNKLLYLWYINNTAGKIYREAGFIDCENNFESWSAYRK